MSDFEYIIEKKLVSQLEFGFLFSVCPNSCHQKCYHVGTLKGLSTLGTSMRLRGWTLALHQSNC